MRQSTGRPPPPAAADAERLRLAGLRRDATALVTRAARPDTPADARRTALRDAADRLRALGAEPAAPGAAILAADLRAALRTAADTVAKLAAAPDQRVDAAPILALLERARVRLEGEVALGLTFQGGYSQSKVKDPVYGGHATAMGPAGPPPAGGAAATAPVASPVTFEEARVAAGHAPTAAARPRTTSSSPAATASRSSTTTATAGSTSTSSPAPSCPRRGSAIPHRNALYRNLGGWRFEDVSAKAGVDAAAWGNGVCAGDADGDGRIDLYVTNWGANLLFRNKGDGTFEDIAAQAGVAAGGWSTGCAFFDADADGDLDLYVARYVRDDLGRGRRARSGR